MNYGKLLEGKTAVITNGDGMGRAIADLFLRHGADVAVGVNDFHTKNDCGKMYFIECDLTDEGSIESFYGEIDKIFPKINIIVNNPCAGYGSSLLESSEEDDQRIINLYQTSIVKVMRIFWPKMLIAEKPSVIYISAADSSNPVYTAANGAFGGLTRVAAAEGWTREIRANEIKTHGLCHDCAADTALFFASEMSSYITGVTINIGT